MPEFTAARLQQVLESFIGPMDQIPPMHSAIKKAGKPLYSYARAGETIARQPRRILIKSIQLIDNKDNVLTVSVDCSKGTYIRVLAEDIGKALGCGGYLLALRRTGIRDLAVLDAIGLDQLGEMDEASRAARLLPVDRLVDVLPAVCLSQEAGQRLVNGLAVSGTNTATGLVRLYDSTGAFLGVGESRIDGVLISKRLVSQSAEAPEQTLGAGLSP
jgi:tRNA pseudouridine55 synthase